MLLDNARCHVPNTVFNLLRRWNWELMQDPPNSQDIGITTCFVSCLDLRFLIMVGEECNAYTSALCNFLHSPVISSLLAPNILL